MMRASLALLAVHAGLSLARPAATACPPSCANNELLQLLDQFCSDKGTFWQSKHHYGTAYHALFGSIRNAVSSILEIGERCESRIYLRDVHMALS